MSFTIKNKYLLIVASVVLIGVFLLGGYLSRQRLNRQHLNALSAYADTIRQYKYKMDSLTKYASERDQIVITQKQALEANLIEKEELRKLNIKYLAEVTSLKSQLSIVSGNVSHTGRIELIPLKSGSTKPVINLPFTFSKKDEYIDVKGGFDKKGVMNIDINVPITVDVWTGVDRTTKDYKAVITTDNPYIKVIDVRSVKVDLLKPKRFGIGIQAGYGINFKDQITAQPYLGVGLSYNLIRF